MKRYYYCGPIMVFDSCVASNWKGETFAVSEDKARSNLTYQAKRYCNKSAGSRVTLPGEIVTIS